MISRLIPLDYIPGCVPETLYARNAGISRSAAGITQTQVPTSISAPLSGMMGSLYTAPCKWKMQPPHKTLQSETWTGAGDTDMSHHHLLSCSSLHGQLTACVSLCKRDTEVEVLFCHHLLRTCSSLKCHVVCFVMMLIKDTECSGLAFCSYTIY